LTTSTKYTCGLSTSAAYSRDFTVVIFLKFITNLTGCVLVNVICINKTKCWESEHPEYISRKFF